MIDADEPPERGDGDEAPERLQKVLARSGVGSRRACEELIAAGRVKVNGEIAGLGRRVDPARDEIELDGALIAVAQGLAHYLLNKPAGVVTTASDPERRPTVVELVPPTPRVFPVGRLDVDTEGLLILTNDGPLAHRLTHPSFGIEKEYLAEVSGSPRPAALRSLSCAASSVSRVVAPRRARTALGTSAQVRGCPAGRAHEIAGPRRCRGHGGRPRRRHPQQPRRGSGPRRA